MQLFNEIQNVYIVPATYINQVKYKSMLRADQLWNSPDPEPGLCVGPPQHLPHLNIYPNYDLLEHRVEGGLVLRAQGCRNSKTGKQQDIHEGVPMRVWSRWCGIDQEPWTIPKILFD